MINQAKKMHFKKKKKIFMNHVTNAIVSMRII